jgi:hypothetical protein
MKDLDRRLELSLEIADRTLQTVILTLGVAQPLVARCIVDRLLRENSICKAMV